MHPRHHKKHKVQKTMLLLTCLFAVVAASPLQSETEWEQPDFCSRECPSFVTLRTEGDYEVRNYEPTKWVSTEYSANSTEARNQHKQAFWRLFRYIGGENSQDVKIPMTIPVTTKIYPCSGDGCQARFIKSFYVPSAFQDDIPVPADSKVYIDNRPEMTLFVRSFSGWASYADHEENIAALMEEFGAAANTEFYYKVGFGPHRSQNAHNEGWMEVL